AAVLPPQSKPGWVSAQPLTWNWNYPWCLSAYRCRVSRVGGGPKTTGREALPVLSYGERRGMLSLGRAKVASCEGLSRREWLQVGGLPILGLLLSDLLRVRAAERLTRAADLSFGRAKSCIVAFRFGAPAHQDIWDLKPDAPSEMRGEFKPIASSVPGIFVGEHIPRIASQAQHLALVRSVSHPDDTHTVAMHYMLTGHRH